MKRKLTVAGLFLIVTAGSLLVQAHDYRVPGARHGVFSQLIDVQSGHSGPPVELPRYLALPSEQLTPRTAEPKQEALQYAGSKQAGDQTRPVSNETTVAVSNSAPEAVRTVTAATTRSLGAKPDISDGVTSSKTGAVKAREVAAIPPAPSTTPSVEKSLVVQNATKSKKALAPPPEKSLLDGPATSNANANLVDPSAPAVIYPLVYAEGDDEGAVPSETDNKPVKKQATPAKELFAAVKDGAPMAARAIGWYARGCLSGGVALPVDGPAWQAMRLSRNRNWGHPDLVKLVERFALDAKSKDGWNGLLVGDLAQPRGGPMLTGHASHQVGLDADIWLTEMPNRKFTSREREDIAATSMLDKTGVAVDPKVFTEGHVKLIKRAASYSEIERVLVHPAIKKALCEKAGTDRAWLGKVRPIYGHFYHMHLRMSCPASSTNCRKQEPPSGDDGCGKEIDNWLAKVKPRAPGKAPKPPPPGMVVKPSPRPQITLAELPAECRTVITSGPTGLKKAALEPLTPPPAKAEANGKDEKAATAKPKKVSAAGSRKRHH